MSTFNVKIVIDYTIIDSCQNTKQNKNKNKNGKKKIKQKKNLTDKVAVIKIR